MRCLVHHCTDAIRPSRAAALFGEGNGLFWVRAQSQGSFSNATRSTAEFGGTCYRSSLCHRGETRRMLRAARSALPGARQDTYLDRALLDCSPPS